MVLVEIFDIFSLLLNLYGTYSYLRLTRKANRGSSRVCAKFNLFNLTEPELRFAFRGGGKSKLLTLINGS